MSLAEEVTENMNRLYTTTFDDLGRFIVKDCVFGDKSEIPPYQRSGLKHF